MSYYLEFSDRMVEQKIVPAKLCCINDKKHDSLFHELSLADRVYYIKENSVIELKNRYELPTIKHISDEDKVVLILKAVLI